MKRSEFLRLTASGLVGTAFTRFPKLNQVTNNSGVKYYYGATWEDPEDQVIYDFELVFYDSSLKLNSNEEPIKVIIHRRDTPFHVHDERGVPQFNEDGSPEMKTVWLWSHTELFHVEQSTYQAEDQYLVQLKPYEANLKETIGSLYIQEEKEDKPKIDKEHYLIKRMLNSKYILISLRYEGKAEFREIATEASNLQLFYSSKYDPNASTGCYLTSSCTIAKGLADDCFELETLRDFRDNYMVHLPEGKAMIKDYYQHAQPVLEAIGQQENPMEFQDFIYDQLVQPALQLIEAGEKELAMHYYHQFVLELQGRLCNPNEQNPR
ncbi:MAG: hypothetical protein AAF598_04485 [Bacteroidota bacterium]